MESKSGDVTSAAVEYFKVPYGDDIYRVSDFGSPNVTWRKLSFSEWIAAGGPAPKALPVAYVKYSWSNDIYAVTFFNPSRSNWLWQHLSPAQWQRAGYPTPGIAGWITGTFFFRFFGSSPHLYASLNGVSHHLTGAEYAAAGAPTPTNLTQAAPVIAPDRLARFNASFVPRSMLIPVAYNFVDSTATPLAAAVAVQRVSRSYGYSMLNWTEDACSPPWQFKGFTWYGDVIFANACRRHDFGYRNFGPRSVAKLGANETTRAVIDSNFYRDMSSICEGQIEKDACVVQAGVFYIGVRDSGANYF